MDHSSRSIRRPGGPPRSPTLAGLTVACLGLALVAGWLGACGGTRDNDAPAVYTEADSGRTVKAAVGDSITIRLSENPSTGYQWQVTCSPGLDVRGDTYAQPSASPELVGAPGTRTIEVEVTEEGTQTVEGSYRRPWEEGEGAVAQRFSLTVAAE